MSIISIWKIDYESDVNIDVFKINLISIIFIDKRICTLLQNIGSRNINAFTILKCQIKAL